MAPWRHIPGVTLPGTCARGTPALAGGARECAPRCTHDLLGKSSAGERRWANPTMKVWNPYSNFLLSNSGDCEAYPSGASGRCPAHEVGRDGGGRR